MIEADGQALIKEKFRHPAKFRIGPNTTKSFREISTSEAHCENGDMCFVDVRSFINGHEADFGRTFILGGEKVQSNPEFKKIIQAGEAVFKSTAEIWKAQGLSGLKLFNHADTVCRDYGYKLNPLMAGHRLGDFPHHLHSKQKLFEYAGTPTKNLWVLEILVISESLRRGAFFEDILL